MAAKEVGDLILNLEYDSNPEDIKAIKDEINRTGVTKEAVAAYLNQYWDEQKEKSGKVTKYTNAGLSGQQRSEAAAETRVDTVEDPEIPRSMARLEKVFSGGGAGRRRKTKKSRKGKKRTTRRVKRV